MRLKSIFKLCLLLALVFLITGCEQKKSEGPLSAIEVKTFLRKHDFKVFEKPVPLNPELLKRVRIDKNNQPVTKQEVLLVNFWATWCASCKAEMPALKKLQKGLEGQDFRLLMVNFGETEVEVVPFLKKNAKSFLVIMDQELRIAQDFNVSVLPTSILVDKQGRVLGIAQGDIGWGTEEVIKFIQNLSRS